MRSKFTTAIVLAILVAAALLPACADENASPATPSEPMATKASEPVATKTNDTGSATAATPKADAKQATATKPAPDKQAPDPPAATPPGPPELHRVKMRLAGSMCMACLHTLEERLRKLQGVDDARIRKQQASYFQTVSPEISSWADSIVIYDEKRLPLVNLRAFIKENGYHSYQVSDKYLDHAPSEKDLKL